LQGGLVPLRGVERRALPSLLVSAKTAPSGEGIATQPIKSGAPGRLESLTD
jgi:hypothetical protein